MTTLTEPPRADPRHESPRADRLPAYVFVLSAGIAAQFMSGQSGGFSLPLSPDRILIPLGVVSFLAHADMRRLRLSPRPVHLAFVAALAWSATSIAISTDTASLEPWFAWWDAFGAAPFALFLLAPVVYGDARRRRVLATFIAGVGVYLSYVSIAQGVGLDSLVFPRYIVETVTTHEGRAYGPSLQVGSNGLQLFAALVCALVLTASQRIQWRKVVWGAVSAACLLSLALTLTRSIWIGTVCGLVAAALATSRTRRVLLWGLLAALTCGTAALTLSADLRESVFSRAGDSRSAYDRLNAAQTAIEVLREHAVVGIGFDNFARVQNDWFWQLDTLPVSATGISVHNVLLGLLVEIGIIGLTLYLVALLLAAAALLKRPSVGHGDAMLWYQAALAYVTCWAVAGMLMPINYALPSTMLWLLLGVITRPSRLGWSWRDEPGQQTAER